VSRTLGWLVFTEEEGHAVSEADVFADLRPLLFAIAYRMVGSVSEAEDLVQESFLRYQQSVSAGTVVNSPKAYLSAVTTRLAIDHLRSARVRREQYVGAWLPEPLITDEPVEEAVIHLESSAEAADSLSLAFLVLLESLSPVERAVFLLRDVFGYDYAEIADVVGKREDNCRQIAARARGHVEARRPRFEASRQQREELAARFFAAVEREDAAGLIDLLAADVVAYGDGGGKVPAAAEPLQGDVRVARFLVGLGRQAKRFDIALHRAEVNGQPGALIVDGAGGLVGVLSLDIEGGQIRAVRSVVNPDKLAHLGPLADLTALLHGSGSTRGD